MKRIIRQRPSPAMIVAGAALIVALAGTAIAGPLATKSALSKSEKKQVKKLINKAAPGLSVANASTVDGANASDLKTSSAFNETSTFTSLGPSFVEVVSATITSQATGRILTTGSAELEGAEADERGQCQVRIDGDDSQPYEVGPDDIGTNNEVVVAGNFAVTRGPGTYTASLRCRALTGTVAKDNAAISVYGLGA